MSYFIGDVFSPIEEQLYAVGNKYADLNRSAISCIEAFCREYGYDFDIRRYSISCARPSKVARKLVKFAKVNYGSEVAGVIRQGTASNGSVDFLLLNRHF